MNRFFRKLRYYLAAFIVAALVQYFFSTLHCGVLALGTLPTNPAQWVTQTAWLAFCWLAFDWFESISYDKFNSCCY